MTTTKYVLKNTATGKYVQSIYASFTNEVENYVVVKLEYTETEVLD